MSNFHIFGKSENIRELPFHIFEGGETIAVKKLIVEWESKETAACVLITSTLIEKETQNLRQQLCSFVKLPTSKISEVEFINPVFYRVQLAFMHNAAITIESMFGEPLPKIKNVFIQLIE